MQVSNELFISMPKETEFDEAVVRPKISFWKDAWYRLRKNKVAMIGLGVILFLVVMGIIGPSLVPYSYSDEELIMKNLPPSAEHWFGTDDLGRDMFARTWHGARISLFIAVMAALIDFIIGITYGGISGYKGGRTDIVMMRIIDVLYGLPHLLLVILLLVVMSPGLTTIIVALSATGWIGMARLVRGQVMQMRNQEYVLAARTLGSSVPTIIFGHMLPNTMGAVIVQMTLTVPAAIFAEAFLSFLGLGVQAPEASWGVMANDALGTILSGHWWRLFFPGFLISITMLSFNLLGDGLRDALDPRLRR
ncbi:dipeptide transport system permease protein [Paenibacillus sp. yr247]|uniref:ABC transporter permease n=1 Tax=Paenibacillus sp. yr247 TaxID=1761880 RepID=UPI000887215F|nr:ABC transporter permease [Paenibacillus sp. yr247]SDP13650.1 dipeptide transport system permease protein [Paenibacillus sp. yr247]